MKMKKITNKHGFWMPVFGVLAIALMVVCNSCKDDMEGKTFLTTDDLMIDDYITQKDPEMSSFLDVADKAGFRGMLHAYGAYTCFVPSNEAINNYVKGLGKSSVADLTEEQCINIIKYHVVRDTLSAGNFVDGRLDMANMLAKYITTRTVTKDGKVVLEVNRQAIVLQKDLRAANGYIHKIDQVLIPPTLTTGEQVMALPDDYSMFKEIMQKTGWIDTLTNNKADGVWYSVFLQSNESLAVTGINNEADLLARLRIDRPDILTPGTTEPDDELLLWNFAAYHCVKDLRYVVDLARTGALQSQAPNQALTFLLVKDSVLVNEYSNQMTGEIEKGVAIDKQSEYTDYSCYNGVLLDMTGYIGPKKRKAQALYWDIAEQPEMMKHSSFRKATIGATASPYGRDLPRFSEITIDYQAGLSSQDVVIHQYYYGAAYDANTCPANHDYLRIRFNNAKTIDFKLPILTEGTYAVWICYRRSDVTTLRIKAILQQDGSDDQEIGTLALYNTFDINTPPEVLLNSGMKRYTAKNMAGTMNSLRFGTMEVKTTGRHTLRFETVDRGRGEGIGIDMLHFIPVDEDQLYPRFDMNGKAVFRDTPCCEIFPYANACSADVVKCP
jgi:uncharacterized surface protein with fasciclin (FAS1) repeats